MRWPPESISSPRKKKSKELDNLWSCHYIESQRQKPGDLHHHLDRASCRKVERREETCLHEQ